MRNGSGLAILIAGDIGAFLLFAILGLRNHEASLTADVFLRTVAPLMLAWFLIAPWFGAFKRDLTVSPVRIVLMLLPAWLVAASVGLLVRSLVFDRPLILSFALVVLVLQGAMLLVWRAVYAAVSRTWPRSRVA
jgi:hypothetical protein